MTSTSDVTINVALPQVEISDVNLQDIKSEFDGLGFTVTVQTHEVYPVSSSWVEIAMMAGTFVAGAAATHYAEAIFNALDRILKKNISDIFLDISKAEKKIQNLRLPRKLRADAIASIRKGLEELERLDK